LRAVRHWRRVVPGRFRGGPSDQQKASREERIEQDIHDLHRLGYAQELFRTMGGFSNFAISFTIISI